MSKQFILLLALLFYGVVGTLSYALLKSWLKAAIVLVLVTTIPVGIVLGYRSSASVTVVKPTAHIESKQTERLEELSVSDVPCWKGRLSDGHYADTEAPLNWSTTENVVWRTSIFGIGHSSPIIRGDTAYLTSANEEAVFVLALDVKTGNELWRREIRRGSFPEKHEKNTHASATPACDAKYVYSIFAFEDGLWLSAVDREGNVAWMKCVGPFRSQYGYGSSLALADSRIFVVADNRGGQNSRIERLKVTSYLAAVHSQTGDIAWRILRPEVNSYGTPIVATLSGKSQLIIGGCYSITSYSPETGDVIWHTKDTAERTASSPAYGNDLIYSSAVSPEQEIRAIRTDLTGDVSELASVWAKTSGAADVCSPLFDDGLLYILTSNGVMNCHDAESGKVVWKKRLQGNYSASPIIAASRLYACSEEGLVTVMATGRRAEVLSSNSLDEPIFATPVLHNGRMLIRTEKQLWCIAEQAAPVSQETTE